MRFGHVFTGFGLLLFAVAAGCGGVTIEPGGTGATGTGATGTGASGNGGATGTGASGSGGGESCSALVTDAVTTPVDVYFHNNTANDLFLAVPNDATCMQGPIYTITDASHAAVSPFAGMCDMTCSSCGCLTTNTCYQFAPVTRIAPNAVFTTQWSGALIEPRTVPAACAQSCFGSTTGNVTCPVAVVPSGYPLTFTATVSTSVSCNGMPCTCTPDTTGTCSIAAFDDPSTGGNPVTGTGTFVQGGTSVDILFQ